MTIKVYQSLLTVAPIEEHEFSGRFSDWLASKGVDYQSREEQPIALIVNGEQISVTEWPTLLLAADDDIEVRPYQHGGAFAIGALIAAAFFVAAR